MDSQRVGHIKEDAALATHILHLGGGEVLESHQEVWQADVDSEKNYVKSDEDDIDNVYNDVDNEDNNGDFEEDNDDCEL